MDSKLVLLLAVCAIFATGAFSHESHDYTIANCVLQPTSFSSSDASIKGEVVIKIDAESGNGKPQISVSVQGVAANTTHGLHIHQWGDISDNINGTKTGPHYNPFGKRHGLPTDNDRHVGDLGNVVADSSGVISATIEDPQSLVKLSGPNSVLGRAIILHAVVDLGSAGDANTGSAGRRIAQCVIGLKNDTHVNMAAPVNAKKAVCSIQNVNGTTNWVGNVVFTQNDAQTFSVKANISGTFGSATRLGIHVHTFGDMTLDPSTGRPRLGGHYNPTNANHGIPSGSTPRHAGDLGNLVVNGAVATMDESFSATSYGLYGPNSFVGRSVVIHVQEDTGNSSTLGDWGGACVIGLAEEAPPTPTPDPSAAAKLAVSVVSTVALSAIWFVAMIV